MKRVYTAICFGVCVIALPACADDYGMTHEVRRETNVSVDGELNKTQNVQNEMRRDVHTYTDQLGNTASRHQHIEKQSSERIDA